MATAPKIMVKPSGANQLAQKSPGSYIGRFNPKVCQEAGLQPYLLYSNTLCDPK